MIVGSTGPASGDGRYGPFPPGFFSRTDGDDDRVFYEPSRLVTHIDERAIAGVARLYRHLGLEGRILDLMSSWISHFPAAPEALVTLGMNRAELEANTDAAGAVLVDLNRHQGLPFATDAFDAAVCCVSVDYLTRPLEVFDEVARVVRPGGVFCCSFSNRCFPTKAIAGWLMSGDQDHVRMVAKYFELSGPWRDVTASAVIEADGAGDPLYAVWATSDG
ncbi:MAG: class I SAM-dependent methyltransferase [Acidimicrobiales bacterium]